MIATFDPCQQEVLGVILSWVESFSQGGSSGRRSCDEDRG